MKIGRLRLRRKKIRFLSEDWFKDNGGKNIDYTLIKINTWYDSNTSNDRVEGSFEIILFNFSLINIEWCLLRF